VRIVFFVHSLVSDWNHGNAHFLRGVMRELQDLGHQLHVWEPEDGWSASNLRNDHGPEAVAQFHAAYPTLRSSTYRLESLSLDQALQGADIVVVHEWNELELVRRIGEHRRKRGGYVLYFHDTHHRSVSEPDAMARYPLKSYDAVLVFGEALRTAYAKNRWADRVFCWHEAADTRLFRPLRNAAREGDLVWIGNFGDEERSAELEEFLIEPASSLGLKTRVYGVRYPAWAIQRLERAGIEYAGYLPNFQVPEVFSRFRVTVHVPRKPYVQQLPGVPTIRPFEALACQIPLLSAPWPRADRLFDVGRDFVMVEDGAEMKKQLLRILQDDAHASALKLHGFRTILERHTCADRARDLLRLTTLLTSSRAPVASTAVGS